MGIPNFQDGQQRIGLDKVAVQKVSNPYLKTSKRRVKTEDGKTQKLFWEPDLAQRINNKRVKNRDKGQAFMLQTRWSDDSSRGGDQKSESHPSQWK